MSLDSVVDIPVAEGPTVQHEERTQPGDPTQDTTRIVVIPATTSAITTKVRAATTSGA